MLVTNVTEMSPLQSIPALSGHLRVGSVCDKTNNRIIGEEINRIRFRLGIEKKDIAIPPTLIVTN
tara:strand:- start:310 stop:504 length:195 start_codon:yes stop_codon:yes gene_type:complete